MFTERDAVVEYKIYPSHAHSKDISSFCESVENYVKSKCKDYIWYFFGLSVEARQGTVDIPPHLYGKTCFGDEIEDEWFLTKILFEISSEFSGCIVSVEDSDGHYMLIEAADCLPEWLDPDTSKNRIFIAAGRLQIIPPSIMESNESLKYSLECVADCDKETDASEEIQDVIKSKIDNARMETQKYHHSTLIIPKTLAFLLYKEPKLVSEILFNLTTSAEGQKQEGSENSLFDAEMIDFRVKFTRSQIARFIAHEIEKDEDFEDGFIESEDDKQFSKVIGAKMVRGAKFLFKNDPARFSNLLFEYKKDPKKLPAFEKVEDDSFEWLEEFSDPSSIQHLDQLLSKYQLDEQDIQEIFAKMQEEESDEYYYDSDSDEEFLEQEILEAAKHDPDLLMKMLEKSHLFEEQENVELLKKLRELKVGSGESVGAKKGLADIDDEKIAEARSGKRPSQNQCRKISDSSYEASLSSDEDDDCEI